MNCLNCHKELVSPDKYHPSIKYCSKRCRNAFSMRRHRHNHIEKFRDAARLRINTGTHDESFFYGYKEPLRKIVNGYGYKGVLTYSVEKDKVQCHLCGKFFRHLNNAHLGKVHEMTAREYKEENGLSQLTALIGEGTREKLIAREHNWDKVREGLAKAHSPEIIAKKRHGKMALEINNKRGNCPDQLLDLIKKVNDKLHHVPSVQDFVDEYGWERFGSIRSTFGSWDNALKQLAMEPVHVQMKKKYSSESLLKYLVDFYKQYGRNATQSDEKRGLVPSLSIYYTKFGTLLNARQLAGLPMGVYKS